MTTNTVATIGFNTQPPKGGWETRLTPKPNKICFNTQPPKGGWFMCIVFYTVNPVSTHSRLKAAGSATVMKVRIMLVSTHSRLKAAGALLSVSSNAKPCFNTQPPKGGWLSGQNY